MNTPGTSERRDVLSALLFYRRAVNALATGQLQPLTGLLRQGGDRFTWRRSRQPGTAGRRQGDKGQSGIKPVELRSTEDTDQEP